MPAADGDSDSYRVSGMLSPRRRRLIANEHRFKGVARHRRRRLVFDKIDIDSSRQRGTRAGAAPFFRPSNVAAAAALAVGRDTPRQPS